MSFIDLEKLLYEEQEKDQKEIDDIEIPKLRIYTAQYNYKGDCRLDVTVKSGDPVFAPTWAMVNNYKAGKLSQEQYTEIYTEMMKESYTKFNYRWNEILLYWKRVVLVCFCPPGAFCHRVLLARMLERANGIYFGEIGIKSNQYVREADLEKHERAISHGPIPTSV